jgi:enoyl-CoA hydratase/carnithine racemase
VGTGVNTPTNAGVRCERTGPVATITLCRPETLNPQTPDTWMALRDIGRELPGDVRVIVVRGEGRSFSAGLDLTAAQRLLPQVAARPPADAEELIAGYQQGFSWLQRPDLISLAAVQGHAIGAGFQLALACDLRILAEDAQLCMAEVGLGLVPDLGGTGRLVDLVGYARALEICVTARRVGAAEAERIGLANLVVPAAELTAAVDDLVAGLLAGSRDAVAEIKALLAGAAGRTPAQRLAAERAAQVRRIRDLAGLGE